MFDFLSAWILQAALANAASNVLLVPQQLWQYWQVL